MEIVSFLHICVNVTNVDYQFETLQLGTLKSHSPSQISQCERTLNVCILHAAGRMPFPSRHNYPGIKSGTQRPTMTSHNTRDSPCKIRLSRFSGIPVCLLSF